MGRNKLSMEEKTRALTMVKEGASIAHVAADLHVSTHTISYLNQAATRLAGNTTTTRKPGTGAKKKTTDRTNAVLRREVMLNPSISSANLKKKHPILLQDVSTRTIQHRLQIDLNLSSRHAAI